MENNQTLKVLCLEDSHNDAELLKEMLADSGFTVQMIIADNEKNFVSSLKNQKYDIILADYTLPGFNASEALKLSVALQPETPFICISGTIGEDKAVELVKQGATDYVLKDRLGRLGFAVNRALNDTAKQKEWEQARRQLRNQEIIEKQNDELRKLNATKDKFFAIISHDLRSPFNSILGFSHILNLQAHQMDKAKIEYIANVIYQSSKSAVNLVSNLIEWSMAQSGNIDFNPENLNLAELAGHEVDLLSPAAGQKKITLSNQMPPYIQVNADRVLIATVIRNLISNAIKFTPEGGQVRISATASPDEVVVSVSDSGVGIPEDKLKSIFQIDKSHSTEGTNKEKGTGLGLIICKEFITLHRGRIWAEAKGIDPATSGTTMLFTLPVG